MSAYQWLYTFIRQHKSDVIEYWLSEISGQYPGRYDLDRLEENGDSYFDLVIDLTIPVVEHPLFPIIPRMSQYHAEQGTPLTHLLSSSHIWRKSFTFILKRFLESVPVSITEVMDVYSQINSRIDELQQKIGEIYWERSNTLAARQEETISMLHNDRLQLLGKMSASMAHELRNPLFAMEGFIKLIESVIDQEPSNTRKIKSYLAVVKEEFRNLYSQITSFLSFSKNSGVDEPFIVCDCTEVIESVLDLSGPRLNSESIVVKLNLQLNFTITIQKVGLQQVLSNVIHNSIDALAQNKGDKILSIHTAEDEVNYYIEIMDNGPGIPEELRNSLFTPFVTSKESGTGLGLAICKQIMSKNVGDITCMSEPGKTKFVLSLVKNCGSCQTPVEAS